MKKALFSLILIQYLIFGCSTNDDSPYSYSNEATIYTDTKTTQFRELMIILNPYLLIGNEKKYIVTDTLKNVIIKINNKNWGTFNSFEMDTSIFLKEKTNNYYSTQKTTKYSVIAPYKSNSDTLKTAGEYSDLLNNFLTLEPGNYICQIVSFDLKQIDGKLQRIKPFIMIPIEVKENTRNALVGEFEVQINNN